MTAEATSNFSSNPSPTHHNSIIPKVSAERESIGKKLIIFAWAVEICAVIIGFAIYIMQGITSFEELEANKNGILGFSDYTTQFNDIMPFLIVYTVKITHIPFAMVIYKINNNKWTDLLSTIQLQIFFKQIINFIIN